MGFKIKSCEKQNIGIISIEGEVDMFTSPNFRDEMLPYFQKGVKTIIVDLKGVSFMDSSGIATLVEGLQWSKRAGKEFILTGLGVNVKNALSDYSYKFAERVLDNIQSGEFSKALSEEGKSEYERKYSLFFT